VQALRLVPILPASLFLRAYGDISKQRTAALRLILYFPQQRQSDVGCRLFTATVFRNLINSNKVKQAWSSVHSLDTPTVTFMQLATLSFSSFYQVGAISNPIWLLVSVAKVKQKGKKRVRCHRTSGRSTCTYD
jgi:hypothetical protein